MEDLFIPDWPCPQCGHERWNAVYIRSKGPLDPVVCGHCHVLFNAAWVDGCWIGRMWESEWPGALTDFVEMRAEALRRKP